MTERAAIVTGSSRGIGRAVALALADIGFSVLVNCVSNTEAAHETAFLIRSKGRRAEVCQADISSADDRSRIVRDALAAFGRIDLLVNNAGVAPRHRVDILEADEAEFERVLSANLKGPYFLTKLVARHMIALRQVDPSSSPKIVNISSVSAYAPSTNRGEYCIAKAGLSMVTKLFAARLAEHGIGVFEVRPGIIQTDMTAAVRERYDHLIAEGLTPIRRWGTPEDVAKAVAAVAGDSFPFSTGEVINVDGGFHLRIL
ncbi:MAG: 3-ketoacyl-ACP reductase [Armatimonadota bacterium]